MKKLFMTLILFSIIILSSSCKKTEYVYISMTKPVDAKGVIMIVDDRKIKVYNKETNTHTKISLKGFYPIFKTDLQAFIDALREKHKRDTN